MHVNKGNTYCCITPEQFRLWTAFKLIQLIWMLLYRKYSFKLYIKYFMGHCNKLNETMAVMADTFPKISLAD